MQGDIVAGCQITTKSTAVVSDVLQRSGNSIIGDLDVALQIAYYLTEQIFISCNIDVS